VDSGTGTAKTAVLEQLAAQGRQVLDLEGMAAHRGSLFGKTGVPQPSQKMFETRLAKRLEACDPEQITFLEAESSKVGERLVPPSVWAAMAAAPRVHITAPLQARSTFLCDAYADLTEDAPAFCALLDRLRPYHPATRILQWQEWAQRGNWQNLAAGLIAEHYDPRYAKSTMQREAPDYGIELDLLDADTIAQTAATLGQRFT
jgi:tRNA 2-selenouridine synthase